MLVVVLILAPIAFAGGLWLAARLFPDRPHQLAARIVDVLTGAAATAVAMNAALAIHAGTGDEFAGFGRGETIAAYIAEALWQGGMLLGLAALVHLVASTPSRSPRSQPESPPGP